MRNGPTITSIKSGDDGQISSHLIELQTGRLRIRQLRHEDLEDIVSLYADPVATAKYGDEGPFTRNYTVNDFNDWMARWEAGEKLGMMCVFDRHTNEFIGIVGFIPDDDPGQPQIVYLYRPSSWGQGFGQEAARAVVHDYAIAQEANGLTFNGHEVNELHATARLDNPGSYAILTNVGFVETGEKLKHGALRKTFVLTVKGVNVSATH